MSDIRAFFGKKTPQKNVTTPPAAPVPIAATKRTNELELLDSDDDLVEEVKPERKRLKSAGTKDMGKKETIATTSSHSISTSLPEPESEINSSKRKAATIDLSQDSSSPSPFSISTFPDDSQNSGTTTQAANSQSSDVPIQSPVKTLGTISRKSTKTTSGNRMELKGSVNTFFGDPDPLPSAPPPPPKKIQKVSHDESDAEDSDESAPRLERKKSKSVSSKTKKSPAVSAPTIPEDIEIHSVPPQGRENCLEGYKIAFTGVMGEYMSRADLEALVLQYGGKVAQSISGKTTFLVASPLLEDRRDSTTSTKYRCSLEREIKIITEKQFLGLIQLSVKNTPRPSNALAQHSIDRSSSTSSTTTISRVVQSVVPPMNRSSSSSSSMSQSLSDHSQLLWVDKYKPKRLEDVIGAAESIRKILDWLKKWPEVHIRKTVKIPFSKENPGGKSLLLSGPPGIGKTTLATLVAKSLGYEVLEFNASDVRSKNAIIAQVSDVVRSQAMGSDGKLKKRVVIMDEVDGMGGSDRGGIPELIKVIKAAHTPIICICNDRQERKIRSLANHCFDIRLRRPTKKMIADRLVRIAQEEGLMIEPNAAELLVEQMGNDIRQVINASQMWRAQSCTMKYRDLAGSVGGVMPYVDSEEGDPANESAGRLRGIQKDKILRQSPFDACGLILGGRKTDFQERYNSFFIDYSLLPLMIEQNYIDSARNGIFKNPGSDAQKLDLLSRAADTISEMDLAGSALRGQDMHWELLPLQAALSLKVGDHVQGFQGFPTFPQWLGKYSTTNKSKRLTQEIVVHTNLAIRQSFDPIRLEYVPYLRNHLVSVLKGVGTSGESHDPGESVNAVEETIQILDDYGLSRDDMMETFKDMQFIVENDKTLFDRYSTIDTKLKTAFTKKYNSMDHKSQALIEEYQMSKRKARSKVGGGDDLEEGEDLETIEDLEAAKEVEEERDSDDEEALKEFLKKHSKKSSGSSSTSKKNASASGGGGGSRRKK